jgi:hypothetical protein
VLAEAAATDWTAPALRTAHCALGSYAAAIGAACLWPSCSSISMLAPKASLHSTPEFVLQEMLALAEVNAADVFIDIGAPLLYISKLLLPPLCDFGSSLSPVDAGCGDGRALLAAAHMGCRAIGWEVNPERGAEASAAVAAAGLTERVRGRPHMPSCCMPSVQLMAATWHMMSCDAGISARG